jgi:rhodanese-related sulfurtransferase
MKNTLTATLLTLTVAMAAACTPAKDPGASLVDVAQAAARQEDRVSVHDLATWIIEGRGDFKLVDVRLPADFEQGTIGDAENIPLAKLVTNEALAGLPTDRKVVVFSNGSENGAKAVVMLRLSGVNAHLVTGGYNAWHARVLNPDLSAAELDGESLQVSEQRAYACYFVGDRGEGATRRPEAEFVPPVFTEEEELGDEPLPPAGAESR